MKANCTVHLGDIKLRGSLYRVVNPDDLSFVSVNFPSTALKYFDVAGTDENDEFRGLVPTKMIEPDGDVEYISFKYCIGDSVDACPFGLSMFEWKQKGV